MLKQQNRLFQLPPSSTIYTAEIYAIKIITSLNTNSKSIIISDSLGDLSPISNPYATNELVQHIQKLIFETNLPIYFMWVPAYIGIPRNEKDMAAYEATTSPVSQKFIYQPHPKLLTLFTTK